MGLAYHESKYERSERGVSRALEGGVRSRMYFEIAAEGLSLLYMYGGFLVFFDCEVLDEGRCR